MARATVSRGRRTARSGGRPSAPKKRARPEVRAAKGTKAKRAPADRTAGRKAPPPVDERPRLRAAPPPVDLDVDPAVLEFIGAIEAYRLAHARPFPSWSEVLHVLRQLGYRKS